jgi:DNA-binding NtrC family response regulator
VTAHACSDKLAIIGGGVSFDRVSQSRYRGNIVMLVEPESSLRNANDTLRLGQALETAGHRVRTVASSAELMQSLDQAQADVVLVSWDGAGPLMAQLASRSPSPTVVPVAYKADPAVVAAASDNGNCYAVAERPEDKRFVRAVDRVMEQRRNDSSFQCRSLKVASAD